jgi:hypothetical protein
MLVEPWEKVIPMIESPKPYKESTLATFKQVGNPDQRLVGPLQPGDHWWFNEEGKCIGLTNVSNYGETIVYAIRGEVKSTLEAYEQAVVTRQKRLRTRHSTDPESHLRIWHTPMS